MALKKYFMNAGKKFYSLLQDSLVSLYNSRAVLVGGSTSKQVYPSPVKKDIFSYL
jgi:hypothetical protein